MIINSFWNGNEFTVLEKLTIESFKNHGHSFKLWTYSDRSIPKEYRDIIFDANLILHKEKYFTYKGNGDCYEGLVGGFSDIFRYHLLYKQGGWYVDMDVTCLQSFADFTQDIVLRPHNRCKVVANIIKFPKGDERLLGLITETEEKITAHNNRWLLPLEILEAFVTKHNLDKYIVSEKCFGADKNDEIVSFLRSNYIQVKDRIPSHAIHWCNTALQHGNFNLSNNFNKKIPLKNTLYNFLIRLNGVS
jgi:hypothetical protein